MYENILIMCFAPAANVIECGSLELAPMEIKTCYQDIFNY